MKTIISCVFFYIATFSFSVSASFKSYEAELGESQWNFDGNPLSCQLRHNVPHYGQAVFAKNGGRKSNLYFAMSYKRQPILASKTASIQSFSPPWKPTQRSRDLGEIPIMQGNTIFKANSNATWRLLSELETGHFPTFSYQEFDDIQDQVSVGLSAVGFNTAYEQFLNCMGTLVSYDLKELKKLTLHFDFDKYKIRKTYVKKLNDLAAYVKFDPSIEIVFINGYTDSKGSRSYNEKLAQRRIASVQTFLQKQGADDSQFKTIAYGEKNPIASNRKASGRAKNRRVYIQVK